MSKTLHPTGTEFKAPSSHRRMVASFLHFLTSNAFGKIVGLASFPIITRLFSKEEYGIIGMVSINMMIMVTLAKAGLSDGILRLHREYSSDAKRASQFASTVLVHGGLWSLVVAIGYVAVIPFLRKTMGIDSKYYPAFLICSVSIFLKPISVICLNTMRALEQTVRLNVFSVVQRLLSAFLSLSVVYFFMRSVLGYMTGLLAAEIVGFLYLIWWYLAKRSIFTRLSSWSISRQLIQFGIPLLLSELSYLLLEYADRFMIMRFHGEAMVGVYSVGYNVSSYVAEMITFSLAYAMVPVYVNTYLSEGKERTGVLVSDIVHYYLLTVIVIATTFTACSNELVIVMASSKYAQSSNIAPTTLLGCFCIGSVPIFNAGLYLSKRTKTMFYIMVSAVVINVVINLYLIPKYDIYGAAFATLIAGAYAAIVTLIYSRRYIAIRVEFVRLSACAACGIVLVLATARITLESELLSIVVKTTIACTAFAVYFFAAERVAFNKLRSIVVGKSLSW